jgi:hypothetical protein
VSSTKQEVRAALEKVAELFESENAPLHMRSVALARNVRSGLLEPGTATFDMNTWSETAVHWRQDGKEQVCGTVMCIGGWAEHLTPELGLRAHFAQLRPLERGGPLYRLCHPPMDLVNWSDVGPRDAARAIRNYLEKGDPLWEEVMQATEA